MVNRESSSALLAGVAAKIEQKIAPLIARRHLGLIGLACGIVFDQELVWSAGFGFADLASGRIPDRATIFRCGSMTKMFTSAALMKLREEGALSIDDPIVRYLPEFKPVRMDCGRLEEITLRRLMTHHSGLVAEAPLEYWATLEFPTIEQILALLPQVHVAVAPDAEFKYSNLGYALLGEVVARVSRTSYSDYVQRKIIEPLGMSLSGFEITEQMRPHMAVGYQLAPFTDQPVIAPNFHLRALASAGQLYSSVTDLSKWVGLQFRTNAPEGGITQVLRGSTLAEMHRVQYVDEGWSVGYCLGWRAVRRRDGIYHRFSGGIHGFISFAALSLPNKVAAIVLTNSSAHHVYEEIAWQILDDVLSGSRQAPTATVTAKQVPVPESMRRFLGRYNNHSSPWGDWGNWFEVVWRDGSLRLLESLPNLPAVKLHATEDPNVFISEPGRERVVFEAAGEGTVRQMRMTATVWTKIT